MMSLLSNSPLVCDTRLNGCLAALQDLFAQLFTDGDVGIAKVELLVRKSKQLDWELLNLGLRGGCAFLLLVWVVWDLVIDGPRRPVDPHNQTSLQRAVPVYRGIGCLVLIPWLWACNTLVWRKARVNYMYLLDCDARVAQSPRKVFGLALVLTS
jgi:xenotropic and polytropic retrovirus receptor 1